MRIACGIIIHCKWNIFFLFAARIGLWTFNFNQLSDYYYFVYNTEFCEGEYVT